MPETLQGQLLRTVTLAWGNGDTLEFTNGEDPDAPLQQSIKELTGWHGGVGVDGKTEQRPGRHGFFRDVAKRTGRDLTLEVYVTYPSETDRERGDEVMASALWDGEFGTLTVEVEGEDPRAAEVRLDGEIKVTPIGFDMSLYVIPLVAPSPFRYGPRQSYQIAPAGQDQGLVYPLFSGAPAPTVIVDAPFDTTGVETITGPEGQVGISTNRALSNSARWTMPTVRNQRYRQTVWARADKPGSHATIRTTRVNGTQSSPYLFWPKPVPTEWTKYTAEIIADGTDITDFRLDLWTNHSGGEVRDARQDIVVTIEAIDSTLSYGTPEPNTRISMVNRGTATAYPVIKVEGSWPSGFSLSTGDGTIEYPQRVYPTAPLVIDCGTRTIRAGGRDVTAQATRRQWFSMEPWEVFAPRITPRQASSGWADISFRDTFI